MKLEDAIPFLRNKKKIYRESRKDGEYLQGTPKKPLGSFYLTLWDILADDWIVE